MLWPTSVIEASRMLGGLSVAAFCLALTCEGEIDKGVELAVAISHAIVRTLIVRHINEG